MRTPRLSPRLAVCAVALPLALLAGCSSSDGPGGHGSGRAGVGAQTSVAPAPSAARHTPFPASPTAQVSSTVVPWTTGRAVVPHLPAKAAGPASLTILLDDGFGIRARWTLTCAPVGGTHPQAAAACGVLGAEGRTALHRVADASTCAQTYGGPQKALVTGTWRGRKVHSQLDLENGCEVARWRALTGLLPAPPAS